MSSNAWEVSICSFADEVDFMMRWSGEGCLDLISASSPFPLLLARTTSMAVCMLRKHRIGKYTDKNQDWTSTCGHNFQYSSKRYLKELTDGALTTVWGSLFQSFSTRTEKLFWRNFVETLFFCDFKLMTSGFAVWISIKKLAGIQIIKSFRYLKGLDHISALPSEIQGGKV